MKIKKKDKLLTIICPTYLGLNWEIIKISNENNKIIDNDYIPIKINSLEYKGIIPIKCIPKQIYKKFVGDISTILPAYSTLFYIDELPSTNNEELYQMAVLKIEKISPFGNDKIIIDFEILEKKNEFSYVLIAAVERKYIECVTPYSYINNNLKNIDSRILCWLELIQISEHYQKNENQILLINDDVDLCLIYLKKNKIVSIRSLYINVNDKDFDKELSYEISYGLQNLLTSNSNISKDKIELNENINNLYIWSNKLLNSEICKKISNECKIKINQYDLKILDDLSNGMQKRILSKIKTLNFIPNEILKKQNEKLIKSKIKKFSFIIILLLTLSTVAISLVYSFQTSELKNLKKILSTTQFDAQQVKENINKIKILKQYKDRSNSALEVLREITKLLPDDNIEFSSFNYNKSKGVNIRGIAKNDDIVYEYFNNLSDSIMFSKIDNESVSSRTIKGIRETIFSISLSLNLNETANED